MSICEVDGVDRCFGGDLGSPPSFFTEAYPYRFLPNPSFYLLHILYWKLADSILLTFPIWRSPLAGMGNSMGAAKKEAD
jgi:hypothetical protein